MLKKILILALTLNTPYILPSHSSPTPGQNLAVSCAALVSGIICSWLAYKDFKKGWQASNEADRHLKILNDMGIKVYTVSKTEFKAISNTLVTKSNYRMDIPSNFSKQQEKEAKEHWGLFLINKKCFNEIRIWPVVGSLILIPSGIIVSIIECIKRFQ